MNNMDDPTLYFDDSSLFLSDTPLTNHFNPRLSISSIDSNFLGPHRNSIPSLSPSSQGAPSLQYNTTSTHSPHSSSSPRSNFSLPDDFFGSNGFSSQDLDLFLLQNETPLSPSKNGLYLPPAAPPYTFPTFGQSQPQQMQGYDDFNILDMVNASPMAERRFSTSMSQSGNNQYMGNQLNYQGGMYQPQPQLQSVPQIHSQVPVANGQLSSNTQAMPQTIQPQWFAQNQLDQTVQLQSASSIPIPQLPTQLAQPARRTALAKAAKPRRKANTAVVSEEHSGDSLSPPEIAPVGKHNKTERRYRQKVQAAQADLRDSVPALRVLYGTSTPEQQATTDIRAADGTVDGLGEITRPNASAKATIFIGARMYIELLQSRTAMLERKAAELEHWRGSIAGMDDLAAWKADFEAREALRAALEKPKIQDDSSDEESDEEDDLPVAPPPKKRGRAPGVPNKAKSKKVKTDDMGGVRVFAAFAMSFSMVPSASTLLKHTNVQVTPGHVLSGKVTPTEVISRLPLITAEHTSRLLARALPSVLVPHPHTMVDWTWRLLVALVLIVLLGPFVSRWSRDEETGAGNLMDIGKDLLRLCLGSWIRVEDETDGIWEGIAAGILGGLYNPPTLAKTHVVLHLHRTATDARSLTLLALLDSHIPLLRSPENLWREARLALRPNDDPALKVVLGLPLDEAMQSLHLLPRTDDPISAIAEQITLVHLNDLYSRLFVHIVKATTESTSPALSVRTLLSNLEATNLGTTLTSTSFDREIRNVVQGVPKQSAAHALGLVLIGLWGVFTGPAPSAQAALASALAAEELQGVPLESVSAMLDLLYPGSSSPRANPALSSLPQNALALDKLALVCIEYIKLLSFARELNTQDNRLKRLEASSRVAKATSHLRLVLTQTKFIGIDQDMDSGLVDGLNGEEENLEVAKERLVEVLSVVGRRAAGRARGRDEDSGLEGDLDEL